MADEKITRDQIEASLRRAQDQLSGKVDDKKQTLLTAVAVGGVVLLLVFFLLGRRTGRKKTTLVEIRRL